MFSCIDLLSPVFDHMSFTSNHATPFRKILGLGFFLGSATEAVRRAERGGLVVVPAAPALKDLISCPAYHRALLNADTVLPDSAFMVMAWNFLQDDSIHRLSGLAYLRELLQLDSVRRSGNTLLVLPDAHSVEQTGHWLRAHGISLPNTHLYAAPQYSIGDDGPIDVKLLELIERLRPQHIILGIGGGTQEPLGSDIKSRITYLPAIHCVGAAIAFLTGEQVRIPAWADRCYLGWLFRTLQNPSAVLAAATGKLGSYFNFFVCTVTDRQSPICQRRVL